MVATWRRKHTKALKLQARELKPENNLKSEDLRKSRRKVAQPHTHLMEERRSHGLRYVIKPNGTLGNRLPRLYQVTKLGKDFIIKATVETR